MSLHTPFFSMQISSQEGREDVYEIHHNCDGGIGFSALDIVDAKTHRLIKFAFNAGKRSRSKEFARLLQDGGLKE